MDVVHRGGVTASPLAIALWRKRRIRSTPSLVRLDGHIPTEVDGIARAR
jgi:hypothetical protein